MPVISRSEIVPYTASEMFALVDAVEEYPKFLPWCRASKILKRDEDEVHAKLELTRGGIHKSFTTCNRLQPDKLIEIRLIDGPFEHLEGFWSFENMGEQECKVALNLEFRIAGKLMSFALEPIFHQIANSFVKTFCKRAEDLYGKR